MTSHLLEGDLISELLDYRGSEEKNRGHEGRERIEGGWKKEEGKVGGRKDILYHTAKFSQILYSQHRSL